MASTSTDPEKEQLMDVDEDLGAEILNSSTDDVAGRTRLLENEIKVPFISTIKWCLHH
jgi:hypothetical protein